MSLNLNIAIAFPVRKGQPIEDYREEIAEWKNAVLWMQENASPAFKTPPATTTLPSVPSALRASNGDEKGQHEKQWLATSGKKSVRFTTKMQALYADKESYCKALCDGTASADVSEDDIAAPPADTSDDGESFI